MTLRTRLFDWILRTPHLQFLLPMLGRLYLQLRPVVLHIDRSDNLGMRGAVFTVDGWFAGRREAFAPALRIENVDLTWARVERPDLTPLLDGQYRQGFRAILDINQILTPELASKHQIKLELWIEGRLAAARQVHLDPPIVGGSDASAQRARKREWLKAHVACPLCPPGTGRLDFTDHVIQCQSCRETFANDGAVLNLLPNDLREQFQIVDWSDISTHQYDPVAAGIIEEVRKKGGKILDCGSGLRSSVEETVICLEVASFPTVDILGVNQRLPFQNAVFDAVFSLNVLEHVTDPFTCASELVRVLKPGGTLYCCIPFLQPEHGYPHHYFNASRFGLRQLFQKDVQLVDHFVPQSGEPIWTLHWFLTWYAKQLPLGEQQRFLNLRLQDVIDRPAITLLGEPWVSELSEEGKWQLASSTAALFRKI